MWTATAQRRSSMPRFTASSSALAYTGGGTMPSISDARIPASAIAAWVASSIISSGVASAPRTYSLSPTPTIADRRLARKDVMASAAEARELGLSLLEERVAAFERLCGAVVERHSPQRDGADAADLLRRRVERGLGELQRRRAHG